MGKKSEEASSQGEEEEEGEEEGEETEGTDEDESEEEEEEAETEQENGNGMDELAEKAANVNIVTFEELALPDDMIEAMRQTWSSFLANMGAPLAAGEAIYSAIFESAPSLQSMFKTPRAVQAMRFMDALAVTCNLLDNPTNLKQVIETLGFCHLNIEVTEPRISVTREAILDLLANEAVEKFTPLARMGWAIVLNWIGGSFIYVRNEYKGRLDILTTSWSVVGHGYTKHSGEKNERDSAESPAEKDKEKEKTEDHSPAFNSKSVPTTFEEMFLFNASVMGFGHKRWMEDVLTSFDSIVKSVYDSKRLQDECNVLAILLSTYKGTIKLNEFSSVMMASLRSLLPKNWGSQHEMAWSWLWSNVQQMLKGALGQPAKQERSLRQFYIGLDEETKFKFRVDIYNTFFAKCSQGQDYFKQSSTRLHYIVDRITELTLGIYSEPKKVIDEISALGLRHVGYGIPVDLFGPFVTSCIEVLATVTSDLQVQEAFRWSLGLVSRVLVRTIEQGSTIVMRAINQNDPTAFKKAVSCAPRGERAEWLLRVQVGSQSISPLMWAIKSGALDAAREVLHDLLTIRADRDHYYYSVDDLFQRHPDVVNHLCVNAPMLLPTLLDGLIWRSSYTEEGHRRVHYYIKNIIVDHASGGLSQSFTKLVQFGDPKIICHPAMHFAITLVWQGVALGAYLKGKAWFIFSLLVFVICQAVLEPQEMRLRRDMLPAHDGRALVIFIGRVFIYVLIEGQLLWHHSINILKGLRSQERSTLWRMPIPPYLDRWYEWASLGLCIDLAVMLAHEPVLVCLNSPDVSNTSGLQRVGNMLHCTEVLIHENSYYRYSVLSTIGVMLYFALILDMHSCFERLSAFALVSGRISCELVLNLCALCFLVCSFSCGIAALGHGVDELNDVVEAGGQLIRLSLGLWGDQELNLAEQDPMLMVMFGVFSVLAIGFFVNVLIAQLNMAYSTTYEDMLGFARLCRGQIILETIQSTSPKRWKRFVQSLQLDQPLQFNEGDLGPAGGLATTEPALDHIVTVDSILRYGGTTNTSAPWPEPKDGLTEDSKIDRLEKMLHKATKKIHLMAHHLGAGGSGVSGRTDESSLMPSLTSSVSSAGSGKTAK